MPWMAFMAEGDMISADTPPKKPSLFSVADAFDENTKTPAINNANARIVGCLKKLNKFKSFKGCFQLSRVENIPQIPFFLFIYAS